MRKDMYCYRITYKNAPQQFVFSDSKIPPEKTRDVVKIERITKPLYRGYLAPVQGIYGDVVMHIDDIGNALTGKNVVVKKLIWCP